MQSAFFAGAATPSYLPQPDHSAKPPDAAATAASAAATPADPATLILEASHALGDSEGGGMTVEDRARRERELQDEVDDLNSKAQKKQ